MRDNLPSEVLESLGRIDSATVANAIEHFKVRDPVTGYASMELGCQFPDLKPMVGYAVTCTADTTTPGDDRPMRMHELLDAIHEAPKPAVLVVQYAGNDRMRSYKAGDMFCTALQKLGVVGLVTDMGNRDLKGIQERAPGFQVFCPGVVVSHGYGVYVEFNTTVSVCGLTVSPGDLVHGDDNGVVQVPLEVAERVVERAREVQKEEAAYFDFMRSDSYSYEGLRQRLGRKD